MKQKKWTIEQLAEAIGDDPLRLSRVMIGEESLGKTAELAVLAVRYNFPPIER